MLRNKKMKRNGVDVCVDEVCNCIGEDDGVGVGGYRDGCWGG